VNFPYLFTFLKKETSSITGAKKMKLQEVLASYFLLNNSDENALKPPHYDNNPILEPPFHI
jgi:hypothetical protein